MQTFWVEFQEQNEKVGEKYDISSFVKDLGWKKDIGFQMSFDYFGT